jgi:predicted enzyme related to lactoylglutathione lyase
MPERTSYAPGTPSWVDIGTDVDAAVPFYTGLFGWEAESAGPDAGGYGMFMKSGKTIAGYGPAQNPGPPVWSSYITVADVEASVAAVKAAGGTVVVPAFDVMTAGRMAVCTDPQGGFFSLWEAREHIGSQIVNEPGAFCWSEINSRDLDGSKAFYGAVFGWTAETHDVGPPMGSYVEFGLDGQTIAGALPMPPMVPPMVPTFWLVYFAVADCDASQAKAVELGATVLMPPMEVPAGRFCVLSDPQGATFAIITLSGEM